MGEIIWIFFILNSDQSHRFFLKISEAFFSNLTFPLTKLTSHILTEVVCVRCVFGSHSTPCNVPPPLSSITNGHLWLRSFKSPTWGAHLGVEKSQQQQETEQHLGRRGAVLSRNENLHVFSFCVCAPEMFSREVLLSFVLWTIPTAVLPWTEPRADSNHPGHLGFPMRGGSEPLWARSILQLRLVLRAGVTGRVLPGASSTWHPVRTHTGMIPVAPLPALKADGERECKTIAFYGCGIYDGFIRCELLNKTFTAL